MAHKAKYGTEGPVKNVSECTIFVCECYTNLMVPMKRCSLKDSFQLIKNTFVLDHLKIRGKSNFLGFSFYFSNKQVYIFLSNATCNSSMSF